ncbi:hypothetical protein V6U79_25705 [Micromonospora sp. CPCC 205556]
MLQLWMTDQEESLDDEQAALATIGLVALRSGLDRRTEPDGELVEQFEELRQAYVEWSDWLAGVPVETVQRYAAGLGGYTFGVLFGQTDFVAELGWILGRSALHDAVGRLTGAGSTVVPSSASAVAGHPSGGHRRPRRPARAWCCGPGTRPSPTRYAGPSGGVPASLPAAGNSATTAAAARAPSSGSRWDGVVSPPSATAA